MSNTEISVLENITQILGYRPDFFGCDLRDMKQLEEIFEKYDFDGVVHFAGLKSPRESCDRANEYFDNNITWSLKLFACMEKYGVMKIIFSSSAAIYSTQGMHKKGLDENADIWNTNHPYGSTKLILENILWDLAKFSWFQVISFRYFNPIWAHTSWLLWENPVWIPNNLFPYIMKVASGDLDYISVFGNDYNTHDGTGIRDYIDVNDLVRGHILWYEYFDTIGQNVACFEVFNLWTWLWISVIEAITSVSNVLWKDISYVFEDRRLGDLAEVYCNPMRAKNILWWTSKVTLDESIKNTLYYHKISA